MLKDPQKQAAARFVLKMKIVKTTDFLVMSVRVKAQRSLFIMAAFLNGLREEKELVRIATMR